MYVARVYDGENANIALTVVGGIGPHGVYFDTELQRICVAYYDFDARGLSDPGAPTATPRQQSGERDSSSSSDKEQSCSSSTEVMIEFTPLEELQTFAEWIEPGEACRELADEQLAVARREEAVRLDAKRAFAAADDARELLAASGAAHRPPAWGADLLPVCEVGDVARCQALLEEHGCVVFRAVATCCELKEAEDLFWRWLERADPSVRRGACETQTCAAFSALGYRATGVLTARSVGQSRFLWHCRQLPGVLAAWRTVWGGAGHNSELVTSFDGCCAWRNPHHAAHRAAARRSLYTDQNWYHLDQNVRTHPDFDSFQGLLNLYAADHATGSTVVVPGSHKDFRENCQRGGKAGQSRGSFVRMTAKLDRSYCQQRAVQVAPLAAGDVLVWDSRTVHCSSGVSRASVAADVLAARGATEQPALARLVAYVAMAPRSKLTQAQAERGTPELVGFVTHSRNKILANSRARASLSETRENFLSAQKKTTLCLPQAPTQRCPQRLELRRSSRVRFSRDEREREREPRRRQVPLECCKGVEKKDTRRLRRPDAREQERRPGLRGSRERRPALAPRLNLFFSQRAGFVKELSLQPTLPLRRHPHAALRCSQRRRSPSIAPTISFPPPRAPRPAARCDRQ